MSLEEPDQGIFIIGMKAKILQSTLRTWYGTLIFMLSPVMEHSIYHIGQLIAAMKETDKSQEQVQAVRPETGSSETKRLSQLASKGPVKVTQRQMWFDLIFPETPPEKTDWRFDTVCQPVESLKTSTIIQTCPCCPHHPWCPACSSSGLRIQSYSGWVPLTPQV